MVRRSKLQGVGTDQSNTSDNHQHELPEALRGEFSISTFGAVAGSWSHRTSHPSDFTENHRRVHTYIKRYIEASYIAAR